MDGKGCLLEDSHRMYVTPPCSLGVREAPLRSAGARAALTSLSPRRPPYAGCAERAIRMDRSIRESPVSTSPREALRVVTS